MSKRVADSVGGWTCELPVETVRPVTDKDSWVHKALVNRRIWLHLAFIQKGEKMKDAKAPEGAESKPSPAPSKPAAAAPKPAAAAPKPTPAPPKPAPAAPKPAPKPASPAKMQPRHRRVIHAFYLLVLLPCILAAVYLFAFAEDQYASTMGFSVQSQEASSAVDLLGGITQLSGNASSDTDILFEFMQSQRLVQNVDTKLDLRSMYNKPSDPVFSLSQDASVEDLVRYWSRIVSVYYSKATGLIEVRVTAYTPKDAQKIGQVIYDESVRMINNLSNTARNDATRYAREELQLAKDRLKESREAIQKFRLRTQIVDPQVDILGRMGVLNSLQEQLATAQIDLDLLVQTAGTGDPRVKQVERRVEVITKRLATERERFSTSEGETTGAYATLVGEYEHLAVDQQFAETSYISALSTLDTAVADAARKSRYLAAYVEPTLAETAEYPRRFITLATLAGFLFAAWAIGVMIYYSLRDRR